MVEPWGDAFYFAHSYAATCPTVWRRPGGVTSRSNAARSWAYNSTPKRRVRRFGFLDACLSPVDPCLDVATVGGEGRHFVDCARLGDRSIAREVLYEAARRTFFSRHHGDPRQRDETSVVADVAGRVGDSLTVVGRRAG